MAQPTPNASETGPLGIYPSGQSGPPGGAPVVISGGAASKIIPGSTSLSLRNNADSADNILIADAGNITIRGTSAMSGTTEVIGGTAEGGALVETVKRISKTLIADNVATTVATVTVPNVATAAAFRCWFMSWISTADTGVVVLDSARTGQFFVVVTRQAGVAAVAAIIPVECSATNAVTNVNQLVMSQIATIASGSTFTSAWSLGAITGAASVSETFTIQVTNDISTGTLGTTNVLLKIEGMNVGAGGCSVA